MNHLATLVKRNIELARIRQAEAKEFDVATSRYWEGYINALESIVHVLPQEEQIHGY
jgi:hypothetical protein